MMGWSDGRRPVKPSSRIIGITSPEIKVTKWQVPIPPSESSEGAIKRGELLERAWRQINSDKATSNIIDGMDREDGEAGQVDEGGGKSQVRDTEGNPCGVIREEDGVATLWTYSDTLSEPSIEGLERLQTRTMDIRKFCTCITHGHDLACLSNERACDVKWSFGEYERDWEGYAMALRERISWVEEGRRALREEEVYQLWPISNDKLLLLFNPSPASSSSSPSSISACRQSQETPRAKISISTLHPFNLKSVQVGTYSPSQSQLDSLEAGFTESLGSIYTPQSAKRGWDLESQLGHSASHWGVYWVCKDLEEGWGLEDLKGKNGVMTIWPTSLVSTTTASPSSSSAPWSLSSLSTSASLKRSRSDVKPPVRLRDVPETQDLMDVATGLFDFMTAYEPPSEGIEEITPETTQPDSPFNVSLADGISGGQGDEMDDPDLFGEHIETRRNSENIVVGVPKEEEPKQEDFSDIDDLFGDRSPTPPNQLDGPGNLDQDIVMSSPPDGAEAIQRVEEEREEENAVPSKVDRSEGPRMEATEGAMVTEDDFDFFDSPTDGLQHPVTQELQAFDAYEDKQDQDDTVLEKFAQTQEASSEPQAIQDGTQIDDTGPTESSATKGPAPDTSSAVSVVPPVPENNTLPVPPTPPAEETLPAQPARPILKKTVTFAKSPSPTPEPPAQPIEAVPSPFQPLDIQPTVSSFAYSLPSPAASPETIPPLRSDLLARLQSSLQKPFDYASEWDIESEDQSLMEEEEDLSGAPPTPVSFIDSDVEPSALPTPKIDLRNETEQIQWEGFGLIGPEWSGLRWDANKDLSVVSRLWKESWGKGKTYHDAEVSSPTKLEKCDWGRMADEIITSRHFRDQLKRQLSRVKRVKTKCTAIAQGDLGHIGSITSSRAVPPTQIHVGYGGNVCQLSIAALHYWRQLGLQPVGGPKNIKALVVCTTEPGSVRSAKAFLGTVGRVYKACQLGNFSIGEAAPAREGVISVQLNAFVAVIAAVLPTVSNNTVIYVLLPPLLQQDVAQHVGKLLSAEIPTSKRSYIKLIPPHATDAQSAQDIAFETYNKIVRPIRPISLRGLPMEIPQSHGYKQYPAWTISPDKPTKPDLTLSWPLKSYDALNRWRMVYAAYGIDHSAKKAMGYVIDEQGEGWDIKTMEVDDVNGVGGVVEGLWGWFREFATTASVEYRLIITCVGEISRVEMEAWRALLTASKLPGSLILVQPSLEKEAVFQTRQAPVPIPLPTFTEPSTRLIDDTLDGKLLTLPRLPIPISTPTSTDKETEKEKEREMIIPKISFSCVLNDKSTVYQVLYHLKPERSVMGLKPDEKEAMEKEEEDVVRVLGLGFYRLSCLGEMRDGMGGGGAVHVEAVKLGLEGLRMIG